MGAIKNYLMEKVEPILNATDKICLHAAELADAIDELSSQYDEIRDRVLEDTGMDIDEMSLGENNERKSYNRILATLEDIKNLINAEL